MGSATDGPQPRLRVTVVGPTPRVRAAAGLGVWLASAAPASARGEVTMALVTDRHMRRLNASFRQVDAATDVLSFPAVARPRGPGVASGATTSGGGRRSDAHAKDAFLGDIAIALGVARRQARAEGHALATELRVLALHGLLHLLGYDHDADQGRMRRVEERLRRRAGLPAGLTARAGLRRRGRLKR